MKANITICEDIAEMVTLSPDGRNLHRFAEVAVCNAWSPTRVYQLLWLRLRTKGYLEAMKSDQS